MHGKIEQIWICEQVGQGLLNQVQAELIQGEWIEGDRNFLKQGTYLKSQKTR